MKFIIIIIYQNIAKIIKVWEQNKIKNTYIDYILEELRDY